VTPVGGGGAGTLSVVETRRLLNDTLPRSLVLAQVALYLWAVYPALRMVIEGELSPWPVVFGLAAAFAAYGISNEGAWAYWLAIGVATLSLLPVIDDAVHRPSLLLTPDFLLLLVIPPTIILLLRNPSARDYVRVWFA
jgi:hypothetical protein